MKRKWLAIGIILLFVGVTITPAIAQNTEKSQSMSRGNWLYVGGSGPGNYTKIQDAINASSNGDNIFVYNGTYYENVEINKALTLLGQNKYGTIIDNGRIGNVVCITAESACIRGFTICNGSSSGVKVGGKDAKIYHNIIANNSGCGIIQDEDFHGTLYTDISNNIIQGNNDDGIRLWRSDNWIYGNTVVENDDFGILLYQVAPHNTIKSNIIKNNNYGISLGSDSNTIQSNTIQDNEHWGIYVSYCDSNTIEDNLITNNGDYGINLENYQDKELFLPASNNNIIGNVISGHSLGVVVESDCDNNVIRSNNITGNGRGIYADVSNNTVIEQNNFIGNTKNVYYRTYWRYDIVFTQNYWDDWHGTGKKILFGKIALFPLNSPGKFSYYWFFIPCFKVDNAPAQEPYNM